MPHGCQMITVAAAGSCNNKQLQRQTAGRKLRYKNDNEQIMNKSEKGQFSYQIIRSDRRTLSLIVRRGEVLVRAPYRHLERENAIKGVRPLSPAELRKLHARAVAYIPGRVASYAPIVGVTYGKITFRIYKSKWGSCKADGSLAFNILLMLTPDEIIDSVIVHELCHRLEMNHSNRFYRQVYRVCPDYDERHRWLKNHRDEIMAQAGLL